MNLRLNDPGGILKFIMRSFFLFVCFVTRKLSQFVNSCLFDGIIKNEDHIINFEIPPADHLTKLILNPVEGSRSAPTRIPNQHQSVMG